MGGVLVDDIKFVSPLGQQEKAENLPPVNKVVRFRRPVGNAVFRCRRNFRFQNGFEGGRRRCAVLRAAAEAGCRFGFLNRPYDFRNFLPDNGTGKQRSAGKRLFSVFRNRSVKEGGGLRIRFRTEERRRAGAVFPDCFSDGQNNGSVNVVFVRDPNLFFGRMNVEINERGIKLTA